MAAPKKVDREQFAALAQSGATNAQLADHFEVSHATITRLRKATGHVGPIKAPPTPEALDKVARLLQDGWSHVEIHRSGIMHPETIRKHFPGTAWDIGQCNDYRRAIKHHARKGWK